MVIEIKESADIDKMVAALSSAPEYIFMKQESVTEQSPQLRIVFIKGYLSDGFADKVFHIYIRYPGDEDTKNKLAFRDYLIAHPEIAAEYAALKRKLFKDYEHDRDGYTDAKSEFIMAITKKAKEEKSYV